MFVSCIKFLSPLSGNTILLLSEEAISHFFTSIGKNEADLLDLEVIM